MRLLTFTFRAACQQTWPGNPPGRLAALEGEDAPAKAPSALVGSRPERGIPPSSSLVRGAGASKPGVVPGHGDGSVTASRRARDRMPAARQQGRGAARTLTPQSVKRPSKPGLVVGPSVLSGRVGADNSYRVQAPASPSSKTLSESAMPP